MTRYLRRRRPSWKDTLKAAALGLGVGAAVAATTFYLSRLFLTREVLGSREDRDVGGAVGGDRRRKPSRPGGPPGP